MTTIIGPSDTDLKQETLPFFLPPVKPLVKVAKPRKIPGVYVINNPSKEGRIEIASGAYTITFIKKKNGEVKMIAYSLDKQVMGDQDNPKSIKHIYNPAKQLACAVLADIKKKKEIKALKKSMF